ncbi:MULTISPECIES: FtsW/RodA/SpoVE family cell cycle protein [unclassified Aeromicrobium]|uniref:FtsW/RodA/SpoVE family cell cycle protein n=2 Tax=Aeromicrobium TaxID=2040 RepID=UPI0006F3E41D|nr:MULTISPECIES: FtsW/RodA/SpoVE family cell cycle protein [unclassified Aeromicrobium]KQO36714.1 cell division protein [Aeromicrobium sp. Leaf245]KQP78061.1 cell division protein [Aeromicrobium sp. Leaf289]KQP83786.1 cell division protein [Aeromicrobium sp. Leaf291]RYY48059.1 MAG: FtsW/RodA/SpoVE family cell cycle protein [Actinomycetales bacterium]
MTTPTLVPRKRRGAELTLTLLAICIGVAAYCAVGLGSEGRIPAGAVKLAGCLVVAAIATHLFVRKVAPYADPVLLPLVICLNGLGLAMIYRIDLGCEDLCLGGNYAPLANSQLIWSALGIVAFAVVLLVVRDHRRLQAYTYTFGFLALALLVLPLLPVIGQNIRGARIWINLGPFSFQPGEAAKICLAIFFAGYLVVKRDALALAGRRFAGIDLPRGRDLGPIGVGWLISIGILVFQRDLGSSLLFFGLFVVMLYIATERPGWLVVGGGLFVVGAYFGYLAFGHVRVRFDAWLDPFADPDRNGQIINGLFGMAYGGILGTGWGQGSPQLTPFSFSDFIAAAMGEELGLTGLMAILVIYGLVVERGMRIALTCRDAFGKLLAAGLAVSMALQIFVVIGGVTRLIPLTGLTTPFMAQGGSSVVMNWAIIALLLRISDQTRRPAPEVSQFDHDEETQVVKLS